MRLQILIIKVLRQLYAELRFLCWEINRKFRNSVTVSTKQGVFTVSLAPEESIGRSLYCNGQYELAVMSNVMTFLRSTQKCPPKREGTILDIGANIGVISIGMLHTGELRKAIAIEPEPHNFSLLQRNVNQNGLRDSIICLPYAVSDQKGEILLELSDTNFGDHRVRTKANLVKCHELYKEAARRVITVRSDQLDNLLQDLPETFTHDISVIWVDVQGYEGYVFMGAKKLLARGTPVVSEIWPYGIKRAGMSQEQFCHIAKSLWSGYWVLRRGRFVRYPTNMLDIFFDELGYDGGFDNVVFTQ